MTFAALFLATCLAGVPPEALTKGKALIVHGRYEEAVRYYEELTAQYPGWLEAQLGLGYSLEHVGRIKDAQASYERALQLDARDVRVLNNLAFLLVDTQQDVPRAIRLLTEAVKLRDGFAPAWDNLGFAYFKSRDYGSARAAFLQALARDSNYAPAQYHMGMISLRQEDFARARKRFERAVTLDATNARGWLALGVTDQKLSDREAAYKAFARAKGLVDHKSPMGREVTRLMAGLGPMYGAELGDLGGTKGTLLDQYAGFVPRGPGASATGATSQADLAYLRGLGAVAPAGPLDPSGAAGSVATGTGDASRLLQRPPTREPRLSFPTRESAQSPALSPWSNPEPSGTSMIMHHRAPPPFIGASESFAGSPGGVPVGLAQAAGAPGAGRDARPGAGPEPMTSADPARQAAIAEGVVKRDLVETHLKLARLFKERGLPMEAQSEAQTVINVAPFAQEASDAREIVSSVEHAQPATPDERIFILLRTAQELTAESDQASAILVYEKVLTLAPSHPVALKDLAYLNASRGRLEEALAQAQKALEVEPDFAEALVIKGYVEARRRRFKDAYDTFKRLSVVSREGTPSRQYADRMAAKMRRFVELE